MIAQSMKSESWFQYAKRSWILRTLQERLTQLKADSLHGEIVQAILLVRFFDYNEFLINKCNRDFLFTGGTIEGEMYKYGI